MLELWSISITLMGRDPFTDSFTVVVSDIKDGGGEARRSKITCVFEIFAVIAVAEGAVHIRTLAGLAKPMGFQLCRHPRRV